MKRSDAGFTIVEIMVAMLVLTVGLLGLLGTTAAIMKSVGESKRTMTAAFYANERLERLEALSCDAIAGGSDVQQSVYTLSWTVSGTTTSIVRDIRLTVDYPLGGGRTRQDVFEKAIACTR